MKLQLIGSQKCRVTFRRAGSDDYEIEFECGGCRCGAHGSRMQRPTLETAGAGLLCFSDELGQGLSGRGCSGRTVIESDALHVFEIVAKVERIEM